MHGPCKNLASWIEMTMCLCRCKKAIRKEKTRAGWPFALGEEGGCEPRDKRAVSDPSEVQNQVPTILNSWDRPTLGHPQFSTSLPHPATTAVMPWTGNILSIRCLPPRSVQGQSPNEKSKVLSTNSFLWNSQQNNLPFRCARWLQLSPPTHPNTPRGPSPHLCRGRTPKMWLCSAQAGTILRQLNNQLFRTDCFPYY